MKVLSGPAIPWSIIVHCPKCGSKWEADASDLYRTETFCITSTACNCPIETCKARIPVERFGANGQENQIPDKIYKALPNQSQWEKVHAPVKFKNLPMGARFKDWGDHLSNHVAPFFCTYEKVDEGTAEEIDTGGGGPSPGMLVLVDPNTEIRHLITPKVKP
jgi:hypothetical protein